MEQYVKQITKIEKGSRTAFTKKYPLLLPFVLESRRLLKTLGYTIDPRYKIKKNSASTWTNISEHSSPLYRKYNTRDLDTGKITNIKIAIQNINGIVVPPGKIFSFWDFVGRPTRRRGFQPGLVLSNGQLKTDVGGGLCQLSNLIAYLFARTECAFVERRHHSKDVFPDSGRTVPFASGATVFYNLIDLKIKNTYPFPIQINLRTTDTQLRGSISAPISLNCSIKLQEEEARFIKSMKTGVIYRCNQLYRVFYSKSEKKEFKKELLWLNVAEVMYEERKIASPISTF